MDVVKTRMQLDPAKYNKGMIGGFRQVIAGEGAGALLTGFGPTASGYFIQGWFKFGGTSRPCETKCFYNVLHPLAKSLHCYLHITLRHQAWHA